MAATRERGGAAVPWRERSHGQPPPCSRRVCMTRRPGHQAVDVRSDVNPRTSSVTRSTISFRAAQATNDGRSGMLDRVSDRLWVTRSTACSSVSESAQIRPRPHVPPRRSR
jgi:hypothetical protein